MRRSLGYALALVLIGVVAVGAAKTGAASDGSGRVNNQAHRNAAAPAAGTASNDMWVVLDPGHGFTYGSDARSGTYTGFQANGLNEDLEVYDIVQRTQTDMNYLSEPILTARDRVAPYQGANGERNVADWDGDRRAWSDSAPNSSTGNLSYTVQDNKTRANYDRAAFANSRPYGGHSPGRIFFSLHFDSRDAVPAKRGTVIYMPCYDSSNKAVVPPNCPGNQAQYDQSAQLARYICKYLNNISGWPGCRLATDWNADYTVLREISRNTPGVLVELINQNDPVDATLINLAGKTNVAAAFTWGVEDYYNGAPL